MAVEQFAVLAPYFGIKEDITRIALPEAFSSDSENVVLTNGEVRACRARHRECVDGSDDLVPLPDGNPVLELHYFQNISNGTNHLIAWSKRNVYHWTDPTWTRICRASADCDDWSVLTYRDKLYFTGYQDPIHEWDSSGLATVAFLDATADTGTVTIAQGSAQLQGNGTQFITDGVAAGDYVYIDGADRPYIVQSVNAENGANAITLTENAEAAATTDDYEIYAQGPAVNASGHIMDRAKYITEFEGYFIAGYVRVNSVVYPSSFFWNDWTDETDWDGGDSGNDRLDGPDEIQGFGKYQDFLMIFKTDRFTRMWLVESDEIFNKAKMSDKLGTHCGRSIVNDTKGRLHWLANDMTFRQLRGIIGEYPDISEAISDKIKTIPRDYISKIRSTFVLETGEVWWAVPLGAEEDENSHILTFKDDKWSQRGYQATAFGRWKRGTSYTIDTIPFDTIDEIGWETIDSAEVRSDWWADLCGDESGNVYACNSDSSSDDGTAITYKIVIETNLHTSLESITKYKRLHKIRPIVRGHDDGSITVRLRVDSNRNFGDVGTVTLDLTKDETWGELTVDDKRGRHFAIELTSTTRFDLVGIIFDFTWEGRR